MTYQIEIRKEYEGSVAADVRQVIERAARVTLVQEEAEPGSTMTVVLTDDETVQAMNEQYRGIAAPTDVLSFPSDPLPPELADAGEAVYQGDVVIAVPYATMQAERHGHSLTDSFSLLVVHGTLHLLGYDHDTDDTRAAMWEAQEEALGELGIDTAIVPTLEDSEH
jgi:probable rRNA maturation factor